MKTSVFLKFLVVLLLAVHGAASAHGGRGHVGVYVGPVWGPAFYPPYYYPSQVIVVPPAPPPVYIEQHEAPAPKEQSYWYYCSGAKGYYPYVKECPDGWQKVLPQPAR